MDVRAFRRRPMPPPSGSTGPRSAPLLEAQLPGTRSMDVSRILAATLIVLPLLVLMLSVVFCSNRPSDRTSMLAEDSRVSEKTNEQNSKVAATFGSVHNASLCDSGPLRTCAVSGGTNCDLAAKDFGGIVSMKPLAFLTTSKTDDLVSVVRLAYESDNLTVAARGNGHSNNGQAMAKGGLVIDMRSLESSQFRLVEFDGVSYSADVPGGALWEEVLDWCLQRGLSPRSMTDYLRLTVGGTLSNAGFGGHVFRHGPQTSNVVELEIVTGKGELVVCSENENAELFFGALGGLGQFGIITRARILLKPAPEMVRWIKLVYAKFDDFTQDAETLITGPEGQSFNYIEGMAIMNSDDPINGWLSVTLHPNQAFDSTLVPQNAGPMLYCLKVTLDYKNNDNLTTIDATVERLLRQLRYIKGLDFRADVSYRDFLLRVNREEDEARARGLWDKPHPWLDIFLSRMDIVEFDRAVFKKILKDGTGGRFLVYPVSRSKFDDRTSLVLPEAEIFYSVSILRFGLPTSSNSSVERLIAQNKEIIKICDDNSFDYKLYLSNFDTQEQWKRHFGRKWGKFVERKRMFDPKAILSPGQNIFTRSSTLGSVNLDHQ